MDPHSFIARAEAQRWLGIAEKLLIGHDLVGSKTFAIRARESDPRLEAADQILAIADTLLAAEKRVVGNNGAHQPDYYAILQLVRFVQDMEQIGSQYRRLAVMLNPHQNRYPYADQAFQLVNDAWAVLSNPMRKSMYDSDLDYPPQQQMNTIGFNLEQQHHQQQHHQQQQQPHNFFSINHMGAGHEQELPEQQQQQQSFQSRLHQSHQQQHQQQLQQHNFLSQPNPVRPLPVREQEHMFQHREQEQLFQPQVQPFQVTSPPHQQTRPSPQPPQQQSHIQSPPATSQSPFSWPQAPQLSQPQHLQHQQVKQEHQHQHQVKQEQQMQQHIKQEQLKQQQFKQEQLKQQQLQQEQLKQQQLQQEQLKQQQLQEEQRKQQQLQQEQLKQQQLQEEQRKQQQLLEEQRKQQQLLEEQRKQQQLQEEQRKQQQLLEEQRKQQQLLEEQRKQQQLQEEQRKQQQLLEEQRKQQQLQEEQRKQQQLQEEQRKQQQLQQEQLKQQQQESVKQNAAPVQPPNQVNNNNGVREEETETEAETEAMDDSPTFWTACPYCFYMYEYPRVYAECTLRCDNCKRAFQAVRISSPPPIIEGQDAYFYCWGFFPLGLSMSHLQKNNNKGTNSNWTPFSSLHNASNNAQNHLNEQAAPKENSFVNKSSGPRIYIDDITDDVFIGVPEPSTDSDTEWVGKKKQKLKRIDKGFKDRIQVLALRAAMYTGKGSVKNLKHSIPVQEGVEVPTVLVVETSKKNVGSNRRKQSGRVAQELGKLDLNVEFNNNEGEETAPRMASGTRAHHVHEPEEEESIEFFEGLDEYLSSLPILSVVNEEKVKVA